MRVIDAPTYEHPFTLATLEDDAISEHVTKLASELLGRAVVDAFSGELEDNRLLSYLGAQIEDALREAILRFETPSYVVAGFLERRGVRV